MKLQHMRHTTRNAGFTLVELMTVVLIVSILAAIAIPTYQNQVRKGRRNDARSAVLDLAGREERYYAATNAYTANAISLGYGATGSGATFPQTVGSGYYAVSVVATNTTFTASATPVTGSPQLQDTNCQYFSVDNTGAQFSSATGGATGTTTATTCWN